MLHLTGAELMSWVAGLLWPFLRVGAMFLAAPLFGAQSVPVRVRLGLSLLLAWILMPLLPPPPAIDLLSLAAALVALQQVVIGLAMGFVLQLVFAALVVAGQTIAMSMGLGFASIVDVINGVQVPVVSQYFLILSTLLFLSLNGHLVLIEVLAESFRSLPVGLDGLAREEFWQLAGWGAEMFAGALLIALPAVMSLLLVNLAFGVVTRAAPQLNIFAVGFPVMMLVGFAVIFLTLPGLTDHVEALLTAAFGLMRSVTGG